ncbi:hypothetical protein ES703_51738 [subsurface metagenome]
MGILAFNRWISPGINEALAEAQKTITTLASLGGMKKGEYTAAKDIEKAVATDLIKEKLPELEALRLILSPSTWEDIEDTIEENPEAVIQLYNKYKDHFGGEGIGLAAKKAEMDF